MASFCLKNAHFPTPSIQPQFWKCSLHCIHQILYAESIDIGLIIRAKDFPLNQKVSHNTSVRLTLYRDTDKRQSGTSYHRRATASVAYLRGHGTMLPPFDPTTKIFYRRLYMKRCAFCHFQQELQNSTTFDSLFFIPIQYAIKIVMWDCIWYDAGVAERFWKPAASRIGL